MDGLMSGHCTAGRKLTDHPVSVTLTPEALLQQEQLEVKAHFF